MKPRLSPEDRARYFRGRREPDDYRYKAYELLAIIRREPYTFDGFESPGAISLNELIEDAYQKYLRHPLRVSRPRTAWMLAYQYARYQNPV